MKTLFKKGHSGYHTKEGNYKISLALKCRPRSEETKRKISNALKGKKKPPFSEEHKSKISIAKKRNPLRFWLGKERPRGENNPKWKGGYENKLWHNRKRQMGKLNINGFHTQEKWETLKAQYNWTCPYCKRQEPEIKLTVDHIVPLSKNGSDDIGNIQPLCKSCNSKKHTEATIYKKQLIFCFQKGGAFANLS